MIRLKEIKLLKFREDLSSLPDTKLLINTINAHSYNTARKDAAFAEALKKGEYRDGAEMVARRTDGTHCGSGFVCFRNG